MTKGAEMGRWVEATLTVMNKTLMACRENGKTPAETARAIDEAYPFGERAHHPYKVWLRERRLFFANHGLPRNGKHKTQKEQLDDLFARMESKMHWARPNARDEGLKVPLDQPVLPNL